MALSTRKPNPQRCPANGTSSTPTWQCMPRSEATLWKVRRVRRWWNVFVARRALDHPFCFIMSREWSAFSTVDVDCSSNNQLSGWCATCFLLLSNRCIPCSSMTWASLLLRLPPPVMYPEILLGYAPENIKLAPKPFCQASTPASTLAFSGFVALPFRKSAYPKTMMTSAWFCVDVPSRLLMVCLESIYTWLVLIATHACEHQIEVAGKIESIGKPNSDLTERSPCKHLMHGLLQTKEATKVVHIPNFFNAMACESEGKCGALKEMFVSPAD